MNRLLFSWKNCVLLLNIQSEKWQRASKNLCVLSIWDVSRWVRAKFNLQCFISYTIAKKTLSTTLLLSIFQKGKAVEKAVKIYDTAKLMCEFTKWRSTINANNREKQKKTQTRKIERNKKVNLSHTNWSLCFSNAFV